MKGAAYFIRKLDRAQNTKMPESKVLRIAYIDSINIINQPCLPIVPLMI